MDVATELHGVDEVCDVLEKNIRRESKNRLLRFKANAQVSLRHAKRVLDATASNTYNLANFFKILYQNVLATR